jgi:NhaP-type Na+/H+ or K+/H+ antiporter
MSFLAWTAIVGALLLFMALASAFLRRVPISTAMIYVVVGFLLGPYGADVLALDLRSASHWFLRATEIAVIVSLFIGGLRLRLPVRDPAWRAALWLAGPVMVATIAGIAAFAHLVLGLDLATALLLGAVLAPTDPVLASAVTVGDAADHDRMRYGLSGEAGLNDGMAFPFVVLALAWHEHAGPGAWLGEWAVHRLLWGVPAGLAIGYGLGVIVGRVAIRLRTRERDTAAPDDFLALALIALSYVAAESVSAWGFLAVFAAGVGLRRAEMAIASGSTKDADTAEHPPPAETRVGAEVGPEELGDPTVAAGVVIGDAMQFGDTVERLFEALLMLLVGVALATHWDVRALVLALFVFVVLRPACTFLLLRGAHTTKIQRALIGWFGIRGIGTLFYLCWAIEHGVSGTGAEANAATDLALSVVALSVLVHGVTVQPALGAYERWLGRGETAQRGAGGGEHVSCSSPLPRAPAARDGVPG